ncbi:MAG: HprK-related kinase B [Pseudomonadota bacterium]|nr:HprK-related kinase B [Pseudomonadota bacterium]
MTQTAKSLNQLAEEFLSGVSLTQTLSLKFEDYLIGIQSNSHSLIENLRHYFADFVVEGSAPALLVTAIEMEQPKFDLHFEIKVPDPGKTKIKEEFVNIEGGRIVRKRLTGMSFLFGGSINLALGPCRANSNQVINFINNRFISYKLNQGCLLGHAAAVTANGRGLALAGFSGMGKSTLALHLMSRGVKFVSNDRLLVDAERKDELKMYGVAKLPRINPGTALNNPDLVKVLPVDDYKRFSLIEQDELWQVEHKYDVFIDDCFGPDRFQIKAQMSALVILNWQHNAPETLIKQADLSRRLQILPAFMKTAGLFYLDESNRNEEMERVDFYQEQLSLCPIYELSGKIDFSKAADLCISLLEETEL